MLSSKTLTYDDDDREFDFDSAQVAGTALIDDLYALLPGPVPSVAMVFLGEPPLMSARVQMADKFAQKCGQSRIGDGKCEFDLTDHGGGGSPPGLYRLRQQVYFMFPLPGQTFSHVHICILLRQRSHASCHVSTERTCSVHAPKIARHNTGCECVADRCVDAGTCGCFPDVFQEHGARENGR